jgi:hypothetical protein
MPAQDNGPPFDAVVVAGDVVPGLERAVRWLLETFSDTTVIFVNGNHELWTGDALVEIEKGRKAASGTKVHFLQNDAVTIPDPSTGFSVKFIGAALWTSYALFGDVRLAASAARAHTGDYRQIRTDFYKRRLPSSDVVGWQARSVAFVLGQLTHPRVDGEKRVLVSRTLDLSRYGHCINAHRNA